MGRAPCCDKANVKRGPWSPEEDATLKTYLQAHGTGGNWIALPRKAGLRRCGKSCRLRWLNYLRPDIKHGGFTEEEDRIICNLYNQMGSRWSVIASQLPGRTDNDVKNYWNTKLKKKLLAGKISLITIGPTNGQLIPTTNNPTTLPGPTMSVSSLQIPNSCVPKVEIFDHSFPNSETQNSATLRMLSDNPGTVYDQRHLPSQYDQNPLYSNPGFMMDFSADEFDNVGAKNSHITSDNVSFSKAGSGTISDSSLLALSDSERASVLPHNGCDEYYAGHGPTLLDFDFGLPCDIVDGVSFEGKANRDDHVAPTCCISLSDLGCVEIRSQARLDQSILNNY